VGALVGAGGHAAPCGIALKVEDGDGARRARAAATSAVLAQLGLLETDELDRLAPFARPVISDPRGEVAGEVRAVVRIA
jgi:L-asparaginase II